jgi:hypothetical protein
MGRFPNLKVRKDSSKPLNFSIGALSDLPAPFNSFTVCCMLGRAVAVLPFLRVLLLAGAREESQGPYFHGKLQGGLV